VIAREVEHKRRRELQYAINGLSCRNVTAAFAVAADDWLARKKPGWAEKTYSAATLDVRHLKQHFAGISDDIHLFNEKLREWEDYYNYHRPHGALGGQTPYERLLAKTRADVSPGS
jgi:transposase InsO family protein